jgi:DNA-binding NarL/FixJ family response regulator
MNERISNTGKHSGKIRIYLADDHEIFRTGLRTVLRFAGEIEITGESGIVPDLPDLLEKAEPEIVLIGAQSDVSKSVEMIKERFPGMKILVLGTSDSKLKLGSAGKLDGYIKKESSPEFLRSAIKTVALGGSVWSPELLMPLIQTQENPIIDQVTSGDGSTPLSLTPREKQLLILLAEGKSNKQISSELHLALVTVKKALQTLFVKVGATNRTLAVMRATRNGLI